MMCHAPAVGAEGLKVFAIRHHPEHRRDILNVAIIDSRQAGYMRVAAGRTYRRSGDGFFDKARQRLLIQASKKYSAVAEFRTKGA
jgi:hypothetical protein